MTDIFISARRGAGAPAEILYGTVTFKPTLAHSRSTSIVLPAPTTFDLVDGEVVATNVQPTPEPVEGKIEWAYEVTFKDRHNKTYSFLVGVPDTTAQVNFTSLPRYYETQPPLFGEGPQGEPGEAATVAVGTVTGGTTAQVSNSGTNTDAVLDFVLPEGPQGPKGDGVNTITPKPMSDTPITYPMGYSMFWNGTDSALGWPFIRAQVITVRSAHDRASQTIYNTSVATGTRVLTRESVGSATGDEGWGPFKEYAWTDLATTSASGLMSSADKTRLDDFGSLPIRSKTATDAPSTYPSGTSVVTVDPSDGWPQIPEGNENVVQVATLKTKDRSGGTLQWVSSFIDAEAHIMFRTALDNGTWGAFYSLAKDEGTIARKGDGFVLASDYGAPGATVGDGVNNDYWTIQRAINDAKGRDVLIEGGKTYLIKGTLTMPSDGSGTVSLKGIGATPPILKLGASGQSYSAIKFEQPVAATTKTLTQSIGAGWRGWPVSSTTGIEPGMICEVLSTAPWYFDPRTDSSDARKSELHQVRRVEGNRVYFEDPSNDGYNIIDESVTLTFYKSISVHLENITVQGTLPAVAEETNAVIGVELQHASRPRLVNVNVENCARTGIRLFLCYNPTVSGGYSIRSNNYWNGYGVSVDGCAETLIENRYTYESRRSVDVTGQNIISRNTRIVECVCVGGGVNSRGFNYGWNDDGTLGAYQGAFGSHGPADNTKYIGNTTISTRVGYTLRGRNESIYNFRHYGRSYGGIIQCSTGVNVLVDGGEALVEHWGKHLYYYGSHPNHATSASRRADNVLRVYPAYNMNPPTGTMYGRVILKNVHAELNNSLVYFDENIPIGQFVLTGNSVVFMPTTSSDDIWAIRLVGTDPGSSKHRWFIGPNQFYNEGSSGAGVLTASPNLSLTGANVINYTTQT